MSVHAATLQGVAHPFLELTMGTTTHCRFELLAKAPKTSNWVEVTRGDNASRSTATLSLLTPPFPAEVASLDGWSVGWVATFFGYSNNSVEPYELTVAVTQDGKDMMEPHEVERGSFDAPTKTLDGACILHL